MAKNNLIKKAAIIIAALVLILVVVSIIKFPESKRIIAEGLENACFGYKEDKEITITGYSEKCSKNVEIPEKINDKVVTKIGTYAFAKMQITNVKIPSTVTVIEDFAFLENNLTEVNLPESLTEIGYGAFETNKLKNVTIPDKVETIKHYAFYDNNLETFTIGKSVEDINLFALSKNPDLKSVIIKQEEGKLDTGAMGTKAQITYTN